LVIWGCGGQAREINLLCEQIGQTVVGFLDERPDMKGRVVDDIPVLGDIDDIASLRGTAHIVCAGVGDPNLKRRFADKTSRAGFDLAGPLVHPAVFISNRNSLGTGTIICEGAVLTVNIDIASHVIINRNSTIGHDVTIESFTTISPGANVSGNVTIEEGVFIGTGASIREDVRIGAWSVVGGGSFVRSDVPSGVLAAGVPAVCKKKLP
jgi:sugar O-acyltransferase (sialic acid O-acetyltransferase NeuD family)